MTDRPTIYMDAVLTPNSSLSPRGYAFVTGLIRAALVLTGIVLAMSLVPIVMGQHAPAAIPVFGFLGLDVAALWIALRYMRTHNTMATRVQITAEALSLDHDDGRGHRKHASVPTAFARVELDQPITPNSWLRIEYGKTAYVIGRFLTPDERVSLAESLKTALMRARAERHMA